MNRVIYKIIGKRVQSGQSGQSGMSSVILVSAISAGLSIALVSFMTLSQSRLKNVISEWDRLVISETVKSTFSLLEAALQRRLWEVPPDEKCMKLTDFKLEGKTSEGVEYSVKAILNLNTNIITMYAEK